MSKWKNKTWNEWLQQRGIMLNHPIPLGTLVTASKDINLPKTVILMGTIGEIIDHHEQAHTYLVQWNRPDETFVHTHTYIDLTMPMTSQARLYKPKDDKPTSGQPTLF